MSPYENILFLFFASNRQSLDDPDITDDELERNYTFFVDNRRFKEGKMCAIKLSENHKIAAEEVNSLYLGYRQLTGEEIDRYTPENPPPRPYLQEAQINTTVEMRAFGSGCNYMHPGSTKWSTAGCVVGTSFL